MTAARRGGAPPPGAPGEDGRATGAAFTAGRRRSRASTLGPVSVRAATREDLPALARMNQRLIEDEGSRNPMSLVELERRFRGWLDAGWQADLFFEAEQCVGYALYQRRVHEYNANLPEIYLRQFFIDRGHRGRRVGTSAFLLLRQHRFSEPCKVVVEVLASNARGQGFWARLGFCPHVYGLELDLGTPPS